MEKNTQKWIYSLNESFALFNNFDFPVEIKFKGNETKNNSQMQSDNSRQKIEVKKTNTSKVMRI